MSKVVVDCRTLIFIQERLRDPMDRHTMMTCIATVISKLWENETAFKKNTCHKPSEDLAIEERVRDFLLELRAQK